MVAAPSRPRGRVQPERRRRGLALQALLLVALGGALFLGPRLIEGRTALHWTRYHASGRSELRPAEWARQTARWAGRGVDLLAPLPGAAEAAGLALSVARQLEPEHPAEAALLCKQLQLNVEQAARSRWRGFGLALPLVECQALRARAEGAAPAAGPSR